MSVPIREFLVENRGRRLFAFATARPLATSVAVGVATLTACALINRQLAKKAEQKNPPMGKFIEIDGVRLHYVERGEGESLLLLHGNGSMIQDFECSGLVTLAAKKYRVIVFDRPGYGYSERPRGTIWSPDAQAALIHRALVRLGVSRVTVMGHSWGASVAIALALKHPDVVASLVLASGYYYPAARADVVAQSGPAVPIFGDLMSLTLAPLISRAMWQLSIRNMFGPKPVPAKFRGFPKEMALRPSQIRARGGIGDDDSRRLRVPGRLREFKDAGSHRRRRGRPRRRRRAICSTSPPNRREHFPPPFRCGTHGSPDRDKPNNVRNQ
jgi:pimeloyl-ACP methyl ester carboxylesterase